MQTSGNIINLVKSQDAANAVQGIISRIELQVKKHHRIISKNGAEAVYEVQLLCAER